MSSGDGTPLVPRTSLKPSLFKAVFGVCIHAALAWVLALIEWRFSWQKGLAFFR